MELRGWLLLIITTIIGLGGLFYAATPNAGPSYGIGLAVFGAAIVFAFAQIKQYFDRIDAGRH
jgi:hypothetical protein